MGNIECCGRNQKSKSLQQVTNEDLLRIFGEASFSLQENYKIMKTLGEGTLITVKSANIRKTGVPVVIKVISQPKLEASKPEFQQFVQDIETQKSFDHKNIVKLVATHQDPLLYYIVVEQCEGQELFEALVNSQSYSEAQLAGYATQILQGIKYFHDKDIADVDVIPENLIFATNSADSQIKISYVGFSTKFEIGSKSKTKSLPFFVSPENVKGEDVQQSDIWSIGAIFYTLLTGQYVFEGSSQEELEKNIVQQEVTYEDKDWAGVSQEAQDFVKFLLQRNIKERPTADDALLYPWIKNTNQEPISTETQTKLQELFGLKKVRGILGILEINTKPTDAERDNLKINFDEIDTDKNGSISKQQMINGIAKLRGIEKSDEAITEEITQTVDRLFKIADLDGSGQINFEEFLESSHENQKQTLLITAQNCLKLISQDGITQRSKLAQVFGQTNVNGTELLDALDVNKDGKIPNQKFLDAYLEKIGFNFKKGVN